MGAEIRRARRTASTVPSASASNPASAVVVMPCATLTSSAAPRSSIDALFVSIRPSTIARYAFSAASNRSFSPAGGPPAESIASLIANSPLAAALSSARPGAGSPLSPAARAA